MGQKQHSRFLNPIGVYSTKYFDDESQLYYYGYRYYFPDIGRWINRDPIGELGSVSIFPELYQETNKYQFVKNDSLNNYDLLGQYTLREAFLKYRGECAQTCSTGNCDPREKLICLYIQRHRAVPEDVLFEIWYKEEVKDLDKDTNWRKDIPTCPCTLCLNDDEPVKPKSDSNVNWRQPGKISAFSKAGHPGGVYEMRSEGNSYGAGQQCVYNKKGIILDGDGAGSEDRKTPSLAINLHIGHDVSPFKLAMSLDKKRFRGPRVLQYFEVRKQNTSGNCVGEK